MPIPPKRFRQPTTQDQPVLFEIVAAAEKLEGLFNSVKTGRYRSLAYTALEEAVMWIEKELASPGG